MKKKPRLREAVPLAQGHTACCTYLEYSAFSTPFIFISPQGEEAFSSKQEYGFHSVETVSFEARDLEVRQEAAFLGGRLWPSGTAGVCLPAFLACFFPGADIKGGVRRWGA